MKSAWLGTTVIGAIAFLAAAGPAPAASLDDLVAAAKGEGELTIIAVPRDWCGYGAVIDALQGEIRAEGQRAQSRRRLRRRDRGDQGQQEQQGPAGAGRDRRRPVLRPVVQGRGPAAALQGVHLGHDPRRSEGRGGILVRRLLRRARLRDQRRHGQAAAGGLGRPPVARLQEHGGDERRSAHVERIDPGHLRGRSLRRPRATSTRRPTPA